MSSRVRVTVTDCFAGSAARATLCGGAAELRSAWTGEGVRPYTSTGRSTLYIKKEILNV